MIHLLEDDINIGKNLVINLELDGYKVVWSKTIVEAQSSMKENHFSLMIFDVNLPDGSSFNLCKDFRIDNSKTPILFLTAQTDEESLLRGFEVGGNDYIKKPFSLVELRARVKAWLKNTSTLDTDLLNNSIIINESNRSVKVLDTELILNRREFDTLVYFYKKQDVIVTREELVSALGLDLDVNDRTIDSHVSRLRTKLKKAGLVTHTIKSEYGIGYRMVSFDSI